MSNSSLTTENLRKSVYCSLFTALIIIGAYISIPIPISPVPIVLADFFVMLAGLFLGTKHGLISVILYLSLGVIGLPVFSNAGGGIAFIFGPTGGFLLGYLPLVAIIGLSTLSPKFSVVKYLALLLVGNIFLYLAGILWLNIMGNLNWSTSVAIGLVPFLPGTIVKIVVVLAIGRAFLNKDVEI